MTHTPGKWVAVNDTDVDTVDGSCIAVMGIGVDNYSANARLIAAAPDTLRCADLLESLCAWMLHRFGPDTPEGKEASLRMPIARAAIAKARGETA